MKLTDLFVSQKPVKANSGRIDLSSIFKDNNSLASDLHNTESLSRNLDLSSGKPKFQVNVLDNPQAETDMFMSARNNMPGGTASSVLGSFIRKEKRKQTIKDTILSMLGIN